MTDQHAGRRHLVTGAGSGIGRAIAELLAGRGARVVVSDVDAPAAEQVAVQIVAAGGDAFAITLDVASREAWDGAAAQVTERLGGLDGLVNNAGITRDRSLRRMSDAEWQQVVDVHLRGTWLKNIALSRLAQPSEIAEAVAFLLSPAASYVTAHVLDVNGGEMHL
jgi:3-oxoacyl-[acyl-carrier protein] reductase